jgi:hypothetical protein
MDININKFNIIPYKQNNIDNLLEVVITENNKIVDLSDYMATVYFELPNGEILNYPCEIINNKINIILTNSVLSNEGKIYFEIILNNSKQKVTTFTTCLKIKK